MSRTLRRHVPWTYLIRLQISSQITYPMYEIKSTCYSMSTNHPFQNRRFSTNLALIFCPGFMLHKCSTQSVQMSCKYTHAASSVQQMYNLIIISTVSISLNEKSPCCQEVIALYTSFYSALPPYRRHTYCNWVTNCSLSHANMFITLRLLQERSMVPFC